MGKKYLCKSSVSESGPQATSHLNKGSSNTLVMWWVLLEGIFLIFQQLHFKIYLYAYSLVSKTCLSFQRSSPPLVLLIVFSFVQSVLCQFPHLCLVFKLSLSKGYPIFLLINLCIHRIIQQIHFDPVLFLKDRPMLLNFFSLLDQTALVFKLPLFLWIIS